MYKNFASDHRSDQSLEIVSLMRLEEARSRPNIESIESSLNNLAAMLSEPYGFSENQPWQLGYPKKHHDESA